MNAAEFTAKTGIPVTAAAGLDVDVAVASPKFQTWFDSVDRNRFKIKSITIQSVDVFGKRGVGFIKLVCDVTDDQGKFVPGIVFIRGGSVAILFVLVCEGKEYAVLCVQPRIAGGSFAFAEIPAGMLDANTGDPIGVAVTEIEQELTEKITRKDLVDLRALAGTTGGAFPSIGGCDETIALYSCVRTVTPERLAEFQGRLTGELAEGEQITLKVVPLDDVALLPDLKSLACLLLYDRHRASIPGALAG